MTDRVKRACDLCAGVDVHPRHVYGVGPGDASGVPESAVVDQIIKNGADGGALVEVMDPSTFVRHFDCCAASGCPDRSCDQVLAHVGDARRESLVDLVESGGLDALAETQER